MTQQDPKQRSNTTGQILDLAETLIQTRGYSTFSYNDIAESLDMTKASIHYHFKSKTDLGRAVIDRYSERMSEALAAIAKDDSKTSMAMLKYYFQPYQQFSMTPDRVCLCGALAGEMLALPPKMREQVDRFFKAHQTWLTAILKRGLARGEFAFSAPPAKMARLILGALQGALLVKRVTNDISQLQDVIAAVKSQVLNKPAKLR